MFCTSTQVNITKPALIHTFLYGKVENSLFFTIINTCYTSQIRLLIICFKVLNHIYREVLKTGFNITTKELFTFDHDFLNLFTINLYSTIVRNLSSRKFSNQFFEHSTLRSSIC